MPSPFCVPVQFMKNPNELCTMAMATTIFIAIPNAAIRVRNPRINPRPPKNSAAIARKANGAGICKYPVKRPMDPEKPGPPNHPNIFCAPCAKKKTPSTCLNVAVAVLSSVASNLRSICDLLFWSKPGQSGGRHRRHPANEMRSPYLRILYLSRSRMPQAASSPASGASMATASRRLPVIIGNVADPGVWSQVHDEGVQIVENSFVDSHPLGLPLRRAQNAIKRDPQAVTLPPRVPFPPNPASAPPVHEK